MQVIRDKIATHPFVVVQEGERFNVLNLTTGLYRFERGKGCSERKSAERVAEAWQSRYREEPDTITAFFTHV